MAFGHRRDRQRDRLRGDDGSGADPQGDRRQAAADDSRRAVERRRAGAARIAGLRRSSTSARSRSRSPSTASSWPTSTSTRAPDGRAAPASSDRRTRPRIVCETARNRSRISACSARRHEQPRHRRHRQHVVQQRRAAGHRLRAGSDRIQQRTPGTPTSTPTSASSKRTRSSRRSRLRRCVYHLAMRDEMLPRFTAEEMPPPPARPGRLAVAITSRPCHLICPDSRLDVRIRTTVSPAPLQSHRQTQPFSRRGGPA